MTTVSFSYLEKHEFDAYAPELFALMHANMASLVSPSGKSYEEEFAMWCRTYGGAFRGRVERQIVRMCAADDVLVGFFGFCADGDTFRMEELQIAPAYRGREGLFRKLYAFVLNDLPPTLSFVEAYADKKNEKSLAVLHHLGLSVVGENESGSCYRLQGTFSDLLAWSRGDKS